MKDLHFSSDGKLVVSVGGRGPCRVWDISSATALTTLSNENGEIFSSCRFSPVNDKTRVLYIAAMTDKGRSIILTWNTHTWKRISSKYISRDAICAFNVSPDGKFLACGTTSGDIVIVNSKNMHIHTTIKAHLGIITALAFSPDSRALASVSFDSSARVTIIEEKKNGGLSLWIAIFIILLAVAAYFLKVEGFEKLRFQYH